jgi:hypothetical protein
MMNLALSFLSVFGVFSFSRYVLEPEKLYYIYWWLDIPMHILGGFVIGYLLVSCLSIVSVSPITFKKLAFYFFIIAIAWELFEYQRDVIDYSKFSSYVDTVKDVAMGYLGLYLLYLVYMLCRRLK